MKITKKKLVKRIILIFLLIVFLAYVIGSFFGVRYVLHENFGRAEIFEYTGYYKYEDYADKYDREEIIFNSGDNKLTGYIYGDGDKGLVIISHGLGGYSESYISETLYFVDHGYKVLGFDNTGSGRSEGEGTMGMAQSVIDLDAALTFAESDDRLKNLPIFLYGHSWGGYAVTAILDSDHDIKAAASVSGYSTPMDILFERAQSMMSKPLAFIEYPFIWLNNKITFGGKANISAVDSINSSDAHVLIIHGTEDETIKFDGASIISHKDEITNPNVEYKIMEGKGHNDLFLDDETIKYIKEKNEEYSKLYDEYDGNVPEEADKKFYDNVDKSKTSKISEEFMGDVNEFFQNALEN